MYQKGPKENKKQKGPNKNKKQTKITEQKQGPFCYSLDLEQLLEVQYLHIQVATKKAKSIFSVHLKKEPNNLPKGTGK
jgi:hypothetical protein